MRVVFMGTPQFSIPILEAILAAGHEVGAVYTRPPAPGGRRSLRPERSAIHAFAQEIGLDVRTPATLREPAELSALRELRPDVAVVVAYGLILRKAVLDTPLLGCWNLHASLLPRWRGAAPIQRAILAGDEETGVCLMRMDAGLDTGPVAGEWRTRISNAETAAELSQRLSLAGSELVARSMRTLEEGALLLRQQLTDGTTYARKIEKGEALIDWRGASHEIVRKVNAFAPTPGAYAMVRMGDKLERVKLLRAEQYAGHGDIGQLIDDDLVIASGNGAVRILEVQRPGKNIVTGREFLSGARLRLGEKVVDLQS